MKQNKLHKDTRDILIEMLEEKQRDPLMTHDDIHGYTVMIEELKSITVK